MDQEISPLEKFVVKAELFWLRTKIGLAQHPWETNRKDIDRALKLERVLNGRESLHPNSQSKEETKH